MMFQIKICGITRAPDADVAVSAGADALGFNFHPLSRRFVSAQAAAKLLSAVSGSAVKVGVFVNSSAQEITDVVRKTGLECVQLHGDEPAELLAQLPSHLSIVSAYRCGARGLAPLADYLDECRAHSRAPDAVLIDADADATVEFGGTGRVADWERIARDRALLGDIPLILAGGLTPANVADAIAAVRPSGVDVASGVESQPGQKDPNLVERFVTAARDAFSRYR